jgi:hypothetical protein
MEPKGANPPAAEGRGLPPAMEQRMPSAMGGMGDLSPAAMCQAMMTSVGKSAEMAAYATPEVRTLFEEWARSVEDEVWAALKARGPLDLATLASGLKISPESVLYFLGKLVREGKATIGGIQARGG